MLWIRFKYFSNNVVLDSVLHESIDKILKTLDVFMVMAQLISSSLTTLSLWHSINKLDFSIFTLVFLFPTFHSHDVFQGFLTCTTNDYLFSKDMTSFSWVLHWNVLNLITWRSAIEPFRHYIMPSDIIYLLQVSTFIWKCVGFYHGWHPVASRRVQVKCPWFRFS